MRPAFAFALRLLGGLTAIALLLVLLREIDRRERAADVDRVAAAQGNTCAGCHDEGEGPGGAHAWPVASCDACHRGDPRAFTRARAHRDLEREPGALDSVAQTCGQTRCHPDLARRVRGSLMATAVGLVSVDRWVFAEQASPSGSHHMAQVLASLNPSPAEHHLQKLCAGCHLGTRRGNRDSAVTTGGSGCGACHSRRRGPIDARGGRPHSTLLATPDDASCLGCHSRSGRISLSYKGLYELAPEQEPPCDAPRLLHDGRRACQAEADVHQQKGLLCVDCHIAAELMGDGREHAHQEDATQIRCQSCHGPGLRSRERAAAADPVTRRRVQKTPGDERFSAQAQSPQSARGLLLHNVVVTDQGSWLRGKIDGRLHRVKPTPTDLDHRRAEHSRLSCRACHARWAPTCTSCHTTLDPDGMQWSFAQATPTAGHWRERSQGFEARPPALGVRAGRRVVPVIPGMIMQLDDGARARSWRLFAQLDPHTTGKSRSCAGCHLSAWALGLGSAGIVFTSQGPRLRGGDDEGAGDAALLPRDRWTALDAWRPASGTRVDLHSLEPKAIMRSLRAGLCLRCHDARSAVFAHYADALDRFLSSSRCPQARWPWLRELD